MSAPSNCPVNRYFAGHLERFIDQADARTRLQIALEVEVPGKGLYRLRSDGIRHSDLIGGSIERGANRERTELLQAPGSRLFEPGSVSNDRNDCAYGRDWTIPQFLNRYPRDHHANTTHRR